MVTLVLRDRPDPGFRQLAASCKAEPEIKTCSILFEEVVWEGVDMDEKQRTVYSIPLVSRGA